jgi:hypothetical protein
MKEKLAKNIAFNILLGIFVFGSCTFVFSQGEQTKTNAELSSSQELLKQSVEEAIKKAVKDIEVEKAKEKEVLAKELETDLTTVINTWITEAKGDKTQELNKLQHRDWSELKKFPSPLPYDYYLRNFTYTIIKADVLNTNSMVSPYKAFVNIEEALYLERYHSPDAAYVEQYYSTVFTPIELLLEYRDDNFVIIEVKRGQLTMERGWPNKQSK